MKKEMEKPSGIIFFDEIKPIKKKPNNRKNNRKEHRNFVQKKCK